ncbi:GntR family transcriptional regulator [Streptomyces sp. NPDC001507]|uniref:GntR family transcriptional regulator n=1 Tax=Streptomyces sp. NPDC001507 TaxID=3364579 RepID=UPI00367DEEB0
MSEEQGGEGGAALKVRDWVMDQMYEGVLVVGSQLPSQRDLADDLGVSRDTVQRVLKAMGQEGWVESHRGSGTRVVMTPSSGSPSGRAVSVDSLMDAAFRQTEVLLDVYSLTAESLVTPIRNQCDRILGEAGKGERPQLNRIRLRVLLPAENVGLLYPAAKEPDHQAAVAQRWLRLARMHIGLIEQALLDVEAAGSVSSVEMTVRHMSATPGHKVYLINGAQLVLSPYEVIERKLSAGGEPVEAIDAKGIGASIIHFVKDDDPDSQNSLMVSSHQAWFDSRWKLLAE